MLSSLVIFSDSFRLPKNLETNKQVYSNYKQHDTAKFLVGSSPQVCVIYVSSGWGGRASDKNITLNSEDLLEWLRPGDTVMSEKHQACSTTLQRKWSLTIYQCRDWTVWNGIEGPDSRWTCHPKDQDISDLGRNCTTLNGWLTWQDLLCLFLSS
jgi:hypothetical protein